VEAAAREYFGVNASQLSLAQAALLAGLPKAPSRYSPYGNPERARERQLYVLARLRDLGWIAGAEYEAAHVEVLDRPLPAVTFGGLNQTRTHGLVGDNLVVHVHGGSHLQASAINHVFAITVDLLPAFSALAISGAADLVHRRRMSGQRRMRLSCSHDRGHAHKSGGGQGSFYRNVFKAGA